VNEDFAGASERSARLSLIREAAIYTPLFIAGVILTVLSVIGRIDSGPILTVIEAILTVLFGYQSIQALRDLQAKLVVTEGVIGRKWSKMDFIVTRSHYVSISRKIFRLHIVDWHLLEEGDRVSVLHYPHTGTVAKIDRIEESGQTADAGRRP
jgi:hypothetical protein